MNNNKKTTFNEQPLKYTWEEVCRMRAMHAEGKSIAEIARVFRMDKFYLRQIICGENRATEDSHERHKAPLVKPRDYPACFIQSPDGQVWKRRKTGPGRFKPVIPFSTIVAIRHGREEMGKTVSQLCVQHQISPSYCKAILARRVRVKA